MNTTFIFSVTILFIVILVFKEIFNGDSSSSPDSTDIRKTWYKEKTSFDKLLYKPRKYLTASELTYFRTLEEKYGTQYYIIPQVAISSLVDVDLPSRYFAYKGYRSKIDKKTLDFVLFDKLNFVPVLAIELDDYTHEFPERVERDTFVNAVMEKVGIKIERVKSIT